jgi:trans-aconitate methyltransferase
MPYLRSSNLRRVTASSILGCAAGALTHFFSRFGATVTGIDSEPQAIAKARSLFPELQFKQADASQLPESDHSFDKAVAGDLVEHLDERPQGDARGVATGPG